MKVLSLFDGQSCGQQAFMLSGINISKYYASEIDKYAISVTKRNFPNTIFMGSVTDILEKDIPIVDILIGGSPCQGFSFSGKGKGMVTKTNVEISTLEEYLKFKNSGFKFEGQSYLFWEYIRILQYLQKKNPKIKFLLENVKMTKKWEKIFNKTIGIDPIEINSSLMSAQNRKRLYWTNIEGIQQPKDENILIEDIIDSTIDVFFEKPFNLRPYSNKQTDSGLKHVADVNIKGNDSIRRVYSVRGKCPTLTTMQGGHREPKILVGASRGRYIVNGIRKDGKGKPKQFLEIRKDGKSNCITTVQKDNYLIVPNGIKLDILDINNFKVRKLSPLECERLQTLIFDNYTEFGLNENNKLVLISNSQRYKMIGNGWTVKVVSHIFNHL